MPTNHTESGRFHHSDEIQDIITVVPSWILRWGVTIFFAILVMIIGLSALIKYPDVVKAPLRIESLNSPKPIVTKVPGKLIKLLVNENEQVTTGQPLAYIESTASHLEVIVLTAQLKKLRNRILSNKPVSSILLMEIGNSQLGELQSSYQSFFQEYLTYMSSIENGFLVRKKKYLENDIVDLQKQKDQLKAQRLLEEKDLSLAEDEYQMHLKLAKEKVETSKELRHEESRYLAKKSPLIQTGTSLITANSNYKAKEKEILELDNQIGEGKSKFSQALNSFISHADDWISKYVLVASQSGKLSYVGIIQENQVLVPNEEVFYIDPGKEDFFGEIAIPQINMGKVKLKQDVLIKLRSYPFEEYGMLNGKIEFIADIPYKDSVFMSKVYFHLSKVTDMKKQIHLKPGMMADAEIITQDATLFQRVERNILKLTNGN